MTTQTGTVRTKAIIFSHKLFRLPVNQIELRSDELGDLIVSKKTFNDAIMNHRLFAPWFGSMPGQERPAMHEALLAFLRIFRQNLLQGGASSPSDAWDMTVKALDNRSLGFLRAYYGEDNFIHSKCGAVVMNYSEDPKTGDLLFYNQPVSFDVSRLYDWAAKTMQVLRTKTPSNPHNTAIDEILAGMVKSDTYLYDKRGRWDVTGQFRGGFLYALTTENYPAYQNRKKAAAAVTATKTPWWSYFGSWTFDGWNFWGASDSKLVTTAALQAASTSARKRTLERRSDEEDEEQASVRLMDESMRASKRRRKMDPAHSMSTATVCPTTAFPSSSFSPPLAKAPRQKPPDCASTSGYETGHSVDDDSEGLEVYNDYWNESKKKTVLKKGNRRSSSGVTSKGNAKTSGKIATNTTKQKQFIDIDNLRGKERRMAAKHNAAIAMSIKK